MSSEGEAGVLSSGVRSLAKVACWPLRAKKVSVRREGFKNQFGDFSNQAPVLTEGEAFLWSSMCDPQAGDEVVKEMDVEGGMMEEGRVMFTCLQNLLGKTDRSGLWGRVLLNLEEE